MLFVSADPSPEKPLNFFSVDRAQRVVHEARREVQGGEGEFFVLSCRPNIIGLYLDLFSIKEFRMNKSHN